MKLELEQNNFVMLFPLLSNIHAIKCTGQICENVAKQYNKKTYVLTYNNDDYTNFKTYCPNVKLVFLRGKLSDSFWKFRLNILLLILRNAKKIDILSFYYVPGNAIFYDLILILYKLLNRKGKLHIRFECEIYKLNNNYPYNLVNGKITSLHHLIKFFFFKCIDIFGVFDYNNFYLSKQKQFWKIFKDKKKIKQQFNGYIDFPQSNQIDYKLKRNVICLAGRLDSPQKGFNIFLNAIENINIKNWEIYLLGMLNDTQKKHIKKLCNTNKSLNGRIHLIGHVNNTERYWEYLLKSKIFCLPSINDGLPLVIPDAMARGNAILSSDLYGLKNIIAKDNDIGFFFKNGDSADLSQKLQYLIDNPSVVKKKAKNGVLRANEILNWNKIVKNLDL